MNYFPRVTLECDEGKRETGRVMKSVDNYYIIEQDSGKRRSAMARELCFCEASDFAYFQVNLACELLYFSIWFCDNPLCVDLPIKHLLEKPIFTSGRYTLDVEDTGVLRVRRPGQLAIVAKLLPTRQNCAHVKPVLYMLKGEILTLPVKFPKNCSEFTVVFGHDGTTFVYENKQPLWHLDIGHMEQLLSPENISYTAHNISDAMQYERDRNVRHYDDVWGILAFDRDDTIGYGTLVSFFCSTQVIRRTRARPVRAYQLRTICAASMPDDDEAPSLALETVDFETGTTFLYKQTIVALQIATLVERHISSTSVNAFRLQKKKLVQILKDLKHGNAFVSDRSNCLKYQLSELALLTISNNEVGLAASISNLEHVTVGLAASSSTSCVFSLGGGILAVSTYGYTTHIFDFHQDVTRMYNLNLELQARSTVVSSQRAIDDLTSTLQDENTRQRMEYVLDHFTFPDAGQLADQLMGELIKEEVECKCDSRSKTKKGHVSSKPRATTRNTSEKDTRSTSNADRCHQGSEPSTTIAITATVASEPPFANCEQSPELFTTVTSKRRRRRQNPKKYDPSNRQLSVLEHAVTQRTSEDGHTIQVDTVRDDTFQTKPFSATKDTTQTSQGGTADVCPVLQPQPITSQLTANEASKLKAAERLFVDDNQSRTVNEQASNRAHPETATLTPANDKGSTTSTTKATPVLKSENDSLTYQHVVGDTPPRTTQPEKLLCVANNHTQSYQSKMSMSSGSQTETDVANLQGQIHHIKEQLRYNQTCCLDVMKSTQQTIWFHNWFRDAMLLRLEDQLRYYATSCFGTTQKYVLNVDYVYANCTTAIKMIETYSLFDPSVTSSDCVINRVVHAAQGRLYFWSIRRLLEFRI